MTDLATTIHNERTKLTATALNGIAIAIAAVGGIAPVIVGVLSGRTIVARGPLRHGRDLLLCRVGPTFGCKTRAWEPAGMNGSELIVILGVPGLFLVLGLMLYVVSSRETARFDRSRLQTGVDRL